MIINLLLLTIEKSMSKIHPSQKVKKFIAEQFDQKAVVLCQFCGGESCPQEDFHTNKIQPNAIQGLHSNWITEDILAMQRPSDRIIKQYKIYEQFKKQKINTILNLQQPGQHPYCGDGLLSKVGFSYNPEGFFANGILFFNQSWEDMTATTFQQMMRIMNIFHISLVQNQGKISVHCHAGRGRTLLVICSWLIYHDRFHAKQTIDLAVEKRQGVLTRSSQRQFLYEFEEQLKKRWKTFSPLDDKNFSDFVQKQNLSLLKGEQKIADQRPFIHSKILIQLRKRLQQQKGKQIIEAMISKNDDWTDKNEQNIMEIKLKINNHQFFSEDKALQNLETKMLVELFYDFYDELPFVIVGAYALEYLLSQDAKKVQKITTLLRPQVIHQIQVEGLAVALDLVHFLKELVNLSLKMKNQQDEDYHKCQSLFIRASILLSSKTKYHPKIFGHKRRCKLISYQSSKQLKYTNVSVINFANFLRALTTEIPKDIDDIDIMILKIRKIDANLHYYTVNHVGKKQGYYKQEDAKTIYENSKI